MTSRTVSDLSVVLLVCLCLIWDSASAVVNPPITSNLLVALDGSDVISLGGTVRSWNDQAVLGGRQDFGNEASATRATYIANQLMPSGATVGVVDFDGSQFLENKSSAASSATTTIAFSAGSDANFNGQKWTWFIVFRPQGLGPGATANIVYRNAYSSGASTGANTMWGTLTQNDSIFDQARTSSGSQRVTNVTPATNDIWYLTSSVWNGSAAAVNGVAAQTMDSTFIDQFGGTSTSILSGDVNANPSGHIISRLGATSSGSVGSPPSPSRFDGQIAELLIYNTALSAADRASVDAYLQAKYFGAPGASNYADAVLADSPVAYWRLNEASGLYPSQVGALPGTPTSGVDRAQAGPRSVDGYLGFADANIAPRFDGASAGDGVDRIDIADDAALDPHMGDFTIEAWLRIDAIPSGERLAIAKLDGAQRNGYTLGIDADGTLAASFRMPDGPGAFADEVIKVNSPSSPSLGEWLHVAAVLHRTGVDYSQSGVSLFVDGELIGSTLDTKLDGINIDTSSLLQFGEFDDAFLWDGGLDEVALYQRALTLDELREHYQYGLLGQLLPPDPDPDPDPPPTGDGTSPEPTSAACLLLSCAALLRRRRQ